MDVWVHGFPIPGRVVPLAVRAEQQGFTGILLADSQLLVGDPYVELALAAAATSRLRVGVGVTNPITRDPSVTASAILTIQAESGGRAELGIARGDSALRQLGRSPASVAEFRQAVHDLRAYLGTPTPSSGVAPLRWLPDDLPRVPVDVAATGPAVIRAGAVAADSLTFNLGADPARLRWAIDLARTTRSDAGLDPDGIPFGAYVDVACHADVDVAADMVRGSASIFVHFLAEGVRAGVPASEADRAVAAAVAAGYAEAGHGESTAPQSGDQVLPRDFLERFALVGPPAAIAERIDELAGLGIERLVVVPASRDVDQAAVDASIELFARDVLPVITPGSAGQA